MKKILRFAKKKRKFSPNASDTASVASAGYELREKDLGKLHKAASTGDLTKLRQLIKKNDVNQLDKENRAPLHLACASGHVEAVTFLVEHKSKLNICDNDNRSPLMKAVQCQQERCAIILLDHNADPNLVDINGNTALHLAALIPNISLVMHLIEREAHMNARNKDGNTPLLLAAIENHQEIVELLLKEGADVNAKDKTGRTALMIAASNGQISLVKLLLHYNADVSLKEDKGWTAEDHAMMNGHHACSHLISEHDTRKKLLQSPYYGPNKVKGNHAAEAGFALGGPATDKDEFQESPEQKWRTSDSEKVTDDASQTESVSRASKGAGDSWLSSNEDEELQFNSKVPQKLSLAKLLNTSQQSKDNVEKTNFCKVRNTDNLHPVESDIESEEESEEDSRDEEEINDNCSPLQPSPQSKTPLLASPQTAMPSSSSFIKTQSNSTPFKGCKQDRSSEEETLPVEICSPNSRVAANQPANLDETSTYSAQAEDTSQQKNRRDLMFELGLEEVEPEENIESPWDSESTTESPQKKSIGSVASSVKEQPKMQHTPANQNNEMLESNTVVQPPLTFEGNKQKSDLVAELGLIDAGDIEESDLKISLLEDEDNEKENFDWKDKNILETTSVDDKLPTKRSQFTSQTHEGVLVSQQKAEEVNLHEGPDFDSRENAAAGMGINEMSRPALEKKYLKVWIEKGKEEIASQLENLTVELKQRFEELRQSKNDATSMEYSEDFGGKYMSNESDQEVVIADFKNNEDTVIEEEESRCDEYDCKVHHLIPEQKEFKDLCTEPTDGRDKQQTFHRMTESKLAVNNDENSSEHPCTPEEVSESKELKWETAKEDHVKKVELSMLREQETDVVGYVTDIDSDADDDSLKLHSGTDKANSSNKNPDFSEKPLKHSTELVKYSSTRRKNVADCTPHLNVRNLKAQMDDLEHSPRSIQLSSGVAAGPYLDEELEGDMQRFKNEVGMLKVVFLALEEKKAQLQKEVEEEKNKHFQNQERNNYDKLGNSELEEENKNNWSIKQNVPHEKSIQHQNNERLDLKLAQEYGDSLRQLKTNVTSKLDKEKQKENFINKDRTRKPVFKGPSKSSASKKFTRPVNISDDLDDLTQSSDTGTDGSESPSSAYKNTPLLIAQLDTEAIDSISLLKIQNLVHEYERAVEREKKRYALLSEKVKYLENERKELHQALDKTKEMKSKLECQKMESDTDFNNVKFSLKQEEEKRKIAEILYEKSREQLQKKELQYCEELKAKQELELIIRNMELERKSLISNIEQLHEDHNELQQQFNREQSIHREIVNSHLHRNHGIEEEDKKALKNAEVATHLCDVNDNEKDVMLQNHSLQNEIAVLKLELVRVRERNQEEQGKYMEQIEALKEKLDDTKKDLKFNEEALTHTALQYNSQLNSLKTEISMLTSKLEHEKQNKEKLETETEAIRSQLSIALKELERSQAAKCESEQVLQREHDEWHHSDEKRNYEISSLRESNNSLSQKLSKEEAKANKLDSELHRATLSLAEKNLMLESVQRSLNQSQARINDLEHTNQLQKEQISKFTVRQESMQERLAQAQSEIMLLRQQLEDAQNKGIMKEKAVTDVQDRFNDIFSKLRRDGERQICLVEERNKELVSKTIEQREQICKFENEKIERETTLRQLQQELADALKKLSMSEASLEVTTRYRNETEEEKIRMQNQLEKLKMELQGMRDGCMQSERKIHHLQNTLDDKERDLITVSQKMQDALSTSSRTKEAAKQFEEHIQRLEIENAKLESMAKQQANKSEVMEKELQDTVSVRTRLEDLITSLQGVKVNLEDQLGQEVQKQTMLSQSVKDSHQLWEEELKTRSKLGLRISQLDREKDDLAGQVESERKKVKKLIELKRSVETRLAQEMKRNNELQKELNRIRTLLKTTKKKLKDYENGQTVSQLAGIQELNHGHSESETTLNRLKTKVEELSQQLETEAAKGRHLESTNQELSAQVASMKILQKNQDRLEKRKHQLEEEVVSLKHQIETNLINYSHIEQYKRDIEEHARKEIKQKLEEVNLFLQTQQASQEALEQLRATNESTIRSQLDQRIKDLELELNKLRTSQQDSINLKDSAQLELERYKELYSEELKLRKSLAAKLDRANERLAETNTKLLNERQRSKSLIANSIMNGSFNVTPALEMSQLQSTMGNVGNLGTFNRNLGNSFLNPVEDGMSSTNKVESYLAKMQEALQKNISKELVQATADLEKESTRVSPLGSAAGSLKSINQDQDPVTRATEQYLEVLKKNYML
ncbi:ankyrin repeat domain-containing protein 26 isoform X7 [Chiloscyllium punctatum]|uniref:ankyrin repeat domain-containing protein 26 isoform X7 n=1 Tax=Chiloscyllium punctatum TaxID=137246 RepID=UPI003B637B78